MLGTFGLKGGSLGRCLGRLPRQGSCRGRGARPDKDLAGGVHLALLLFGVSGLGVASTVLCFSFSPASLLCPSKGAYEIESMFKKYEDYDYAILET